MANPLEQPDRNGQGNDHSAEESKHSEVLLSLIKGLNIPQKTADAAISILSALLTTDVTKNDENLLCTCLLYAAIVTDRFDTDKTVGDKTNQATLPSASDLLCYANVTVTEFLTKMQEVQEHYQFSKVVQQKLTALKMKYLIVSPLFVKFEKIFKELFISDEDPSNPSSLILSQTKGINFKKKLCWTIFVYVKSVVMQGNQELITAFQLLLSSINYVLNATPSFQLKPPLDMLRQASKETLPELCTQYGAKLEEVRHQERLLINIVKDILQENDTLNLWRTQDMYTERYRREADIDELMFLSHHKHLVEAEKITESQSTEALGPPQTPVSAALNTVRQLQELLRNSPTAPSEMLEAFFKECPTNPLPSIRERLSVLRDKFIAAFTKAMGPSHEETGQQRFTLSVRLYYRVMESLLKMEEERLHRRDFPHLLNSDIFHKSLCACSAIVVMASYGNHPTSHLLDRRTADMSLFMRPPILSLLGEDPSDIMEFPWILDVFGLDAYEFYKMIESFIRAEPKLTKGIIKHLQEIENKVLESDAWKSTSSIYQALTRSAVPVPTAQEPERPPTTATSEMFMSPLRGAESVTTATSDLVPGSPRSPTLRRSHTLNNFYNKVCRLSYNRLQALCTQLDVASDIQQRIWTCLECCLSNYWNLMKDRHIDQLMMCSVYAICRVQDAEIRFKRIVSIYSNMPHTMPEVYKRVLIGGNERSSIIVFYNTVFMPQLKTYILQFADSRQVPSMSPVPRSVASPIAASPVYSIPSRKNFFISPMKNSPFKSPITPGRMTPRTSQLYSFGEGLGSAEKLKSINESIRSANRLVSPVVCRSQKRLQFDQPELASNNNNEEGNIIIKKMRKSLRYDSDMSGSAASEPSPVRPLDAKTDLVIKRSSMISLNFGNNNPTKPEQG